MGADTALETVDSHWAVRVVEPEDRAAVVRYATSVLHRIGNGDASPMSGMPPLLVPLASAYALAGREWLDFDGSGSPAALLSERQSAVRRLHVEAAAGHAFLLTAALPVEAKTEEQPALLFRTLLLAALARVGRRSSDFEQWLLLFGRVIWAPRDEESRWDVELLRRTVELWTHVLRGSGPSGLRSAMEIVASIREEREMREAALLGHTGLEEEPRLKLHLFSLFHLAEAATELLLFRVHAAPDRILHQLYGRLLLAREGAAGDPRLDATCDWLFEASRLVVEARTSQLELLSEPAS
jgi:hypothetical protein